MCAIGVQSATTMALRSAFVILLVLHLGLAGTRSADYTSSTPMIEEDDDEKVSYEGAQLLRVSASSRTDQEELLKLEDLGAIDTWNEVTPESRTVDVLITQENKMKVKEHLRNHNISYQISIEDVQGAIDAQNPNVSSPATGRAGYHPLSWNAYHSLDDIYAYMQYLDHTYDWCNLITIGTSHQGREIKGMQIYLNIGGKAARNHEPAIYIDGGFHGREWVSVSSVLYIMREIAENWEDYKLLPKFTTAWFYIFPVLNPDGYEYTRKKDRMWRKNRRKNYLSEQHYSHHHHHKRCSGVDLNRNFGYKWGGAGSSSNECKETYQGMAPFSEPETKAYSDFIIKEYDDNGNYHNAAYLSFHSYGQSITFPWSYDRLQHDNYMKFQGMGMEMAARMKSIDDKTYKVGGFAPTYYPASGTSMDWAVAVPEFLYSYTIALRDTGRFGFLVPAHQIAPAGSEAMQVVVSLF